MRIAVVGVGYVGLVSGACFSDFGHTVRCIDKDDRKITAIKGGIMPIYEPGLEGLVARNMADGRLAFSTDLSAAIKGVEAVFVAVGTPSRRGDGYADLQYVYAAASEIARAADGPLVVVTKSTVPVGTGDEVERILRRERPDIAFHVVSNPEFLREGSAINDFKRPDRIVVGVSDEHSRAVLKEIYRPLYLNKQAIQFTGRRTAELIKYASNAFLAVKITFINEMADLCEKVGADVQQVAHGMGLDNRIGPKFLHAGPGYGGSCFPKDTLALVKTGQDYQAPLRIVETVVSINDQRKRAMARKIVEACGGSVREKTIALLGLTFKPNTDDMRDAPVLSIVASLQDLGVGKIMAYDPEGVEQARAVMSGVTYVGNAYECLDGADAVAIITEWDEFRALDLNRMKSMLKTPIVVDLRNIYDPDVMRQHGLSYTSIGRPNTDRVID